MDIIRYKNGVWNRILRINNLEINSVDPMGYVFNGETLEAKFKILLTPKEGKIIVDFATTPVVKHP